MPGSNVINLDAYRPAEPRRLDGDALSLNPVMPAAAMLAMGFAFWSNAVLIPAYVSLSILEAWSQSFED